MRCNFCGAERTLPYQMKIEECPFCKKRLAKIAVKTRVAVHTPKITRTTRREDFDIVGTVLRSYKGTDPVVYVPEGITELGMLKPGTGAFYENKSVQKIVLPKSLRAISPKAFASSTVQEVVFSDGIVSISDHAFENSDLRQITLPATVNVIGNSAFRRCRNLGEVVLPAGLNEIGDSAFEECTKLFAITLPMRVNSIGQSAFKKCFALQKINIPTTLTQIGNYAFANTGLEAITIPGSITKIPLGCFSHCLKLKSLNLQRGINTIGDYSFSNCKALTEVLLPEGISYLDDGAFEECHYLTRVVIPDSVIRIAATRYYSYGTRHGAFHNCTALVDVTYPVKRFDPQIFTSSQYYNSAIERKKQSDAMMIAEGKCPNCNEKFSFWTKRCRKCGMQY